MDWLVNPYNLGWVAISVFVVGTIILVAVGFVVGMTTAFRHREKKDGLR